MVFFVFCQGWNCSLAGRIIAKSLFLVSYSYVLTMFFVSLCYCDTLFIYLKTFLLKTMKNAKTRKKIILNQK